MEIKRVGSRPSGKGPADWLPARFGSTRCSKHPSRLGFVRQRHVRAGCSYCMAHASARSDADRDGRLRSGPARGRSDRGDSAGRRGLVRAWRETLARRDGHHGDDAHRHSGEARRQGRGLDGEGQRRTIPGLIKRQTRRSWLDGMRAQTAYSPQFEDRLFHVLLPLRPHMQRWLDRRMRLARMWAGHYLALERRRCCCSSSAFITPGMPSLTTSLSTNGANSRLSGVAKQAIDNGCSGRAALP